MSTFLRAISHYLPERRVSNADLVASNSHWNADEIFKRTGIRERRIADQSQTASDLAFLAAEQLFEKSPHLRSQVDAVIFCSQSPDYVTPATACLLQDRLGLSTSVAAFDYNLGCSGFPCGMWLAKALIESGSASNIFTARRGYT